MDLGRIEKLSSKLENMRGEENILRKQFKEMRKKEKALVNEINETDEALLIAQAVAKQTQKKIFELSRLKGYERDQIATLLNIAPATVSVHLTIANRNVRAFLSSHLYLISIGIILYSNYLHFIFSLTNNN